MAEQPQTPQPQTPQSAAAPAVEPKAVRLADYRPPDWTVETVELTFDLDPAATRVASVLRVRAAHEPEAGRYRPLVLDGEDLELLSLAVDGIPHPDPASLLTGTGLTLPAPAAAFTVEIVTRIDPAANTRLEGLYVSSGNFCTQCEAEGFRRITFFPDRPDVMARYRVTIRAERETVPVLLSNGNRVEAGALPDGRHFAVWDDPFPKPAYLFALVAGDLARVSDSFTTASGRAVALHIYVEHGNEGRCDYAMDALKRSMRWDEERYGLEYDLDVFNIVAVSDFNMGAMENKSLNVFNAKYVLADPETATDTDYANIESIIAHEYFHNWTGNRVTCRDWFQLGLKEGLTVFRDQEFSADMRSRAVRRIQDVRVLRARQFPEDGGPLAHPVRPDSYIEINNFYTATVYDKGAEVIGMMQRLLGREGFRRGMDLYFRRHDGQAVTCDDFVAAMEDANGADLGQFRLWYAQAGTPQVTAQGHYDPASATYTLTLEQTLPPTPGQPDKAPMHIPLALGLIGPDGADLPLHLEGEPAGDSPATSRVIDLKTPARTLRFTGIPSRPVLSLNRQFSAPVKLRTGQDDAELAFLMAHDGDPFNRWEAGQSYATRLLLAMVDRLRRGGGNPLDRPFAEAMGRTLGDSALDPAFRALAATLPAEDALAEQMAEVDVEAIHAAREALRGDLAAHLAPTLRALYGSASNAAYSPDADAAGRRALRNVALAYLALSPEGGSRLAAEHYRAADNMTDRMAALAALNDGTDPARDAALADFEDRFRGQPLVLDKWFALQAASARPDTLSRVQALMAHPAFTLRNPNRVRSLIGGFSVGNPLRFHAADGAGYRFLAERVLELDRLNPQVASRLVAPLGRWRRFDSGRQAQMRAALERILAEPGLSRDVYEIATKSAA